MSRLLPSDCVNLILSYLPLAKFSQYSLSTSAWNFRAHYRYNLNNITNMKVYLLRAATEHHDVSKKLYEYNIEHSFHALLSYHAAIAGDWGLVESILVGDRIFTPFILYLAAAAGELPAVQRILVQDYRGYDSHCLGVAPNVLNYLITKLKTEQFWLPRNLYLYILAHATLSDLEKIELHNPILFSDIILSCKYKISADKVNRFGATHYIFKKLFYNEPTALASYEIYTAIICFAVDSLDDNLLGYYHDIHALTTLCDMEKYYACIPNARVRAEQLLAKMLNYVPNNPILNNYIIIIKLLLGILTTDDITAGMVTSNLVVALLQHEKFDLIYYIDGLVSVGVYINNYIFTKANQLICILNCKNIYVSPHFWMLLFTLPLFKQIITQYPDSANVIINMTQKYIPDCLELIREL